MDEVNTLEIVPGVVRIRASTWDSILERKNPPEAQLVFTSLRDIATNFPDELRGRIIDKFGIPPSLFDKVCLESNGFSGCEPVHQDDGHLAHYNHWSCFIVKQTFRKQLRPKPTFTRHDTILPGRGKGSIPMPLPIHGSETKLHGWEWYKMTFFVHWAPPHHTTVICSGLPQRAQASLQSALGSAAGTIDFCDPYSVFDVLLHEVISLYDNSVWSIRDHICDWEAKRQEEPDYGLLHEIARHAIHVSETLTVASESAKDLHQQHEDFTSLYMKDSSQWRRHRSPLRFPQRILEALLARSESNKARLQTEIQLAFHTAAQRDSKIQVQIGEEARKETTAMKALAVITMTFLPATFISSVFSTPFFRYEDASEEARGYIAVSDQFWIYWALAGPLSVATFALWAFWDRTRARTGVARMVDDARQKDKEASHSIIPWRHKSTSVYRTV